VSAKIYAEGGGTGQLFDTLFRQAWNSFFRTAGCAKRYSKGKVSYELLARLDPGTVEASCSHAQALLDRLRLF
jgi:hypothetical protein